MQRPNKLKALLQVSIIFFMTSLSTNVKANNNEIHLKSKISYYQDTSVATSLKNVLKDQETVLSYPLSVKKFYKECGYMLVWVAPETTRNNTWDAMMFLDCIIQYGLVSSDYHPHELLYDKLHAMEKLRNNISNTDKAKFDVLLTDAILTLINNLHFGKLNPDYTADKIDEGAINNFSAVNILQQTMLGLHFKEIIDSVQPKSKQYIALQNQMHLLNGVYTGDCYEIPESQIRIMAINLERMRWAGNDEPIFISANIPSFTLNFNRPDTIFRFKIIAGKPTTATPVLESVINSIEISKGWNTKSNRIYFTFYNRQGVYLGNTPDQLSFNKPIRAFSNGTLSVEHAQKLATILLTNDGDYKRVPLINKALKKNGIKSLTLKKAVPFRVNYFTCEVIEGVLFLYGDIYNRDKDLEMRLYNVTNELALDLHRNKVIRQ
jgi:murein L,D-transpeptidase YcbB/YkuD